MSTILVQTISVWVSHKIFLSRWILLSCHSSAYAHISIFRSMLRNFSSRCSQNLIKRCLYVSTASESGFHTGLRGGDCSLTSAFPLTWLAHLICTITFTCVSSPSYQLLRTSTHPVSFGSFFGACKAFQHSLLLLDSACLWPLPLMPAQ